jgi:hypothetical protein
MKAIRTVSWIGLTCGLCIVLSGNCFADMQGSNLSEFRILNEHAQALENLDRFIEQQPEGEDYRVELERTADRVASSIYDLIRLMANPDSPDGDIISATPGNNEPKDIICNNNIETCICNSSVSCSILESWCALTGGSWSHPIIGYGGICEW